MKTFSIRKYVSGIPLDIEAGKKINAIGYYMTVVANKGKNTERMIYTSESDPSLPLKCAVDVAYFNRVLSFLNINIGEDLQQCFEAGKKLAG